MAMYIYIRISISIRKFPRSTITKRMKSNWVNYYSWSLEAKQKEHLKITSNTESCRQNFTGLFTGAHRCWFHCINKEYPYPLIKIWEFEAMIISRFIHRKGWKIDDRFLITDTKLPFERVKQQKSSLTQPKKIASWLKKILACYKHL